MNTPFQNDYVTICLLQEILYIHYKQAQLINFAAAKAIVRDRIRYQDQVSYPILCDISAIKYIDYNARNYLAQEGSVLTKVVALICRDAERQLMSDYYVTVCQPTVPTAIFSEEGSAVKYLENYKKSLL